MSSTAARPPSSRAEAAPKTKTKTEPSTVHQAFVDWWHERFAAVRGKPYHFRGKRDGAIVQRLRTKANEQLAELKRVADALFADEFFADKGFDLGTLDSQWDKLATAGRDPAPRRNGTGNGADRSSDEYLAKLRATPRTAPPRPMADMLAEERAKRGRPRPTPPSAEGAAS